MTTVIRAAGAADFLALVPRLLGCVPRRSIALVPFSGNRTSGVLRVDLPTVNDLDEIDRVASTFIGLVCKVAHVDGVAAVVYTDDRIDGDALPHGPLIRALIDRADLCGLRVSDALCVAADGWGSYLDDDLPAGGRALDLIPHDDAALSDLPMRSGDHTAGASLPPVDLAASERTGRVLAELERLVATGEVVTSGPVLRAASGPADPPALFEDALGWAAPLDPADAAGLIFALSRPVLRDVALVQWARDLQAGDDVLGAQLAWLDDPGYYPREHVEAITGEGARPDPDRLVAALAVCRQAAALAPRACRPGPLATCAWLSWALGRSTHAAAYAETALEIEPTHGMAGIVLTYVNSAHLPEWAFAQPRPPQTPVARLIDSAGVERGGGRRKRRR
jgi:hypothetical protein